MFGEETEPKFKFTFVVSSGTGARIEFTNIPHESVSAYELKKHADEFFGMLPHFIARAFDAARQRHLDHVAKHAKKARLRQNAQNVEPV